LIFLPTFLFVVKLKAEELDLDMADPELHKAATKIQASFRGHKARKDVEDGEDGENTSN
jgi:hypothetical protein